MSDNRKRDSVNLLKSIVPELKNMLQLNSIGRTKVEVVSGALAGATLEVSNSFSCGSDADCDLVLFDPSVAPRHIEVKTKDAWSKSVRLTAVGGAFSAADQWIDKGQWIETRLPVTVDLCGSHIKLDHSINVRGQVSRVGSIAALAISLGGLVWGGTMIADALVLNPIATTVAIQEKTQVTPKPLHADITSNESVKAIKDKLQDLNLLAQIQVAAGEGGNIQLIGKVGTLEVPQWREFLKWYDLSGNPPLLNSVERIAETSSLPRIAAISYGSNSRVILTNGEEVKVGENFGPNLVLKSISRDEIVVNRGNDTITLKARL